MTLQRKFGWLLAVLISSTTLSAQSNDLLGRIWAGMQQAHAKYTTTCGIVTETRTSKLIVKPMVLHGRFCSQGADRFSLDYAEPTPMHIRINENYLNITGADGRTEARNIGGEWNRFEAAFSGDQSLSNLRENFDVTAQENSQYFEMKLVPRSQGFRRKLNYLVVRLSKQDFLPRSLEIDGRSGVNSVYAMNVTEKNIKLPEDTFKVVKK